MTSNRPTSESKPAKSMRDKIHEIIFGAETTAGATFDIALLVAIVLSVIVICLETVETDEMIPWEGTLYWLHWFFTILFTLEYFLRIYCVRRPVAYIFSFWGIIDLISFLPDYLLLMEAGFVGVRGLSVIRALRLLRVFRIFKLGWFQAEADELGNAIWRARAKIVVFLTAVLIIVTVTGAMMYEIELAAMEGDSMFNSIPEGIYWAIVTMTTVGFGDIVPRSLAGKFLSSCLILLGYSLIIVPTGFISAEVIESKKRLLSARACASCVKEGHDSDASFCKYCGAPL